MVVITAIFVVIGVITRASVVVHRSMTPAHSGKAWMCVCACMCVWCVCVCVCGCAWYVGEDGVRVESLEFRLGRLRRVEMSSWSPSSNRTPPCPPPHNIDSHLLALPGARRIATWGHGLCVCWVAVAAVVLFSMIVVALVLVVVAMVAVVVVVVVKGW